jgi:hypothetical protein
MRGLLPLIQHRLHFFHFEGHQRRKTLGVLHNTLYILVTIQDKAVAPAIDSLTRKTQQRRFAMEYGISLVPVFLSTGRKEIDLLKRVGAGQR